MNGILFGEIWSQGNNLVLMTVLLGVDGPGVLDDTSFRLKVNTALYV
jgi:hypothetical protein